jgi:molybdopterin synthase sulfur carrier subunit
MQRFQADPADPTTAGDSAVTVLLFGSLREAAGWGRRELPLPAADAAAATPAALWRRLGLEPHGSPCRVAVNHHFASLHTSLEPGDEVAFLPPISGG